MSSDDVRAVWQAQSADLTRLTPEEIRRRIEGMERRMRRNRIDSAVAVVLIAIVIVGIAVMFANLLLVLGAIATVGGLVVLMVETSGHRRRAPVADSGTTASLDYHRALLQHSLEFHRKRLWLRVLSLAPGGLLFFTGFAAARPDLAAIVYFELATFLVAIALIVPLNRRAAAKLERRIAELQELG